MPIKLFINFPHDGLYNQIKIENGDYSLQLSTFQSCLNTCSAKQQLIVIADNSCIGKKRIKLTWINDVCLNLPTALLTVSVILL